MTVIGILALFIVAAVWLVSRKTWGNVHGNDPMYVSGRKSLCQAPHFSGRALTVQAEDLGLKPRSRGAEQSWTYEFDAGALAGGEVNLCSEYGSLEVRGVDGTRGRLHVTASNPFPGGGVAVRDTRLSTYLLADGRRLQLGVWQETQGLRAFRSWLAKGARATMVNMVLELPRNGVYDLRLVANHNRIVVRDLDIRGSIGGYLSPGCDLDVRLAGSLDVKVNGDAIQAIDLRGGIKGNFRPIGSGTLEVMAQAGNIDLTLAGQDVGFDVTVQAASSESQIHLGDVVGARTPEGLHARDAAYEAKSVQTVIRASSKSGTVVVRCGGNRAAEGKCSRDRERPRYSRVPAISEIEDFSLSRFRQWQSTCA